MFWQQLMKLKKSINPEKEIDMSRAERRRLQKQEQKKTRTYTFTESYLKDKVESMVKAEMDKEKEDIMNQAVNQAMLLLFVLPMEVLMDHYWQKSYAKKIPEFTQHLLDYYSKWQNDELSMEEMKKDLWEYGGVRFEEIEM